MKQLYEAPQVQVINMEVQGIIAASPSDGTVGKPSDYPNGGSGFGF